MSAKDDNLGISPEYIDKLFDEMSDKTLGNDELTIVDNPWKLYLQDGNITYDRTSGIEGLIRDIRHKTIHELGLRGSSAHHVKKSFEEGLISSKVVDDWYEDDHGLTAYFNIDPRLPNLSDKEFIYRLAISTMAAINYGLAHADIMKKKGGVTLPKRKTNNIFENWPEERTPTIMMFYAENSKERKKELLTISNIAAERGEVISYPSYFLQEGGRSYSYYHEGKGHLRYFKEGRSHSNTLFSVQEHEPSYLTIDKKLLIKSYDKSKSINREKSSGRLNGTCYEVMKTIMPELLSQMQERDNLKKINYSE